MNRRPGSRDGGISQARRMAVTGPDGACPDRFEGFPQYPNAMRWLKLPCPRQTARMRFVSQKG